MIRVYYYRPFFTVKSVVNVCVLNCDNVIVMMIVGLIYDACNDLWYVFTFSPCLYLSCYDVYVELWWCECDDVVRVGLRWL